MTTTMMMTNMTTKGHEKRKHRKYCTSNEAKKTRHTEIVFRLSRHLLAFSISPSLTLFAQCFDIPSLWPIGKLSFPAICTIGFFLLISITKLERIYDSYYSSEKFLFIWRLYSHSYILYTYIDTHKPIEAC